MRSFGSDNNSGVHPRVMEAIVGANSGHAVGYGDDAWTREAEDAVRELVGREDIDPFFVFNGTGANVIALQACTLPFHHVICAATAHIAVDECGAPVKLTGCALKEIVVADGKLTPEAVRPLLHGFGVEHHSQPKVIAISQTTEMGTAYTPQEIRALADLAHEHGMYLFVDGTRMANAAAFLNVTVKEMTVDCGVDIFTFGGTKNGLMIGEVLVPLRRELAENIRYYRKQTTQLYSKMRYLAAQFIPYIREGIWLENARRSNASARRLAAGLREAGIHLTQEVQSNALFFTLPEEETKRLRDSYFFYDWDEARNERRLVCSWDTSEEDIAGFMTYLNNVIKKI